MDTCTPDLFSVESVVLNAVNAVHTPNEGRNAVSTVLPPGRYFVGDIGNVLPPLEFQRLVVQGPAKAFSLRGFRGVYGRSAQRSGTFTTNTGHPCMVQHGVIGVVPLLLMANPPNGWYGEGLFARGLMFNANEDIVVIVQNGVLTAAVGYDRRIVLDTRPGMNVDESGTEEDDEAESVTDPDHVPTVAAD